MNIAGLHLCRTMEAKRVCLMTDSQIVVNQVKGEYEAQEESMEKILGLGKGTVKALQGSRPHPPENLESLS